MPDGVVTGIFSFILSFISAIGVFLIQRRIKKNDAEQRQKAEEHERRERERDEEQRKFFMVIVNNTNSAIALSEATARAVQRIPDAHCNGDMHAALDYATKMKHESKDFLTELGIKHLI